MSNPEQEPERDYGPEMDIMVGGLIKTLGWGNTTLFTFRERHFDHIFVADYDDESGPDGTVAGMYIFRQVEAFPDIEEFIMDNDFPHIHMPYVPDTDRDAFERALLKDLFETDGVPDEFFNGEPGA